MKWTIRKQTNCSLVTLWAVSLLAIVPNGAWAAQAYADINTYHGDLRFTDSSEHEDGTDASASLIFGEDGTLVESGASTGRAFTALSSGKLHAVASTRTVDRGVASVDATTSIGSLVELVGPLGEDPIPVSIDYIVTGTLGIRDHDTHWSSSSDEAYASYSARMHVWRGGTLLARELSGETLDSDYDGGTADLTVFHTLTADFLIDPAIPRFQLSLDLLTYAQSEREASAFADFLSTGVTNIVLPSGLGYISDGLRFNNVSPVPIPAPFALLSAALAALSIVGRRPRKSAGGVP